MVLGELRGKDASCRREASESVGPVRYIRKCLGVGTRLVWSVLERVSAQSEGPRGRHRPGYPRRRLGRLCRRLPFGVPRRGRPRRPQQLPGRSPREAGLAWSSYAFILGRVSARLAPFFGNRCLFTTTATTTISYARAYFYPAIQSGDRTLR